MRGSLLGQASGTSPLPTPPLPFPVPKEGLVQLPVPFDQQQGSLAMAFSPLLFLVTADTALLRSWRNSFPMEIQPRRNSRAGGASKKHFSGDCFKTRLFQASSRTKDVGRSAQHHSVDKLPAGALPSCFPDGWQPAHPLHPPCSLLSMGTVGGEVEGRGGDRKTPTATPLLSPQSLECGRVRAALGGRRV